MKTFKMLIGSLALGACAVASFACSGEDSFLKPTKLYTQTKNLKEAIGTEKDCVKLAKIIDDYVEANRDALVEAGKDLASLSGDISLISGIAYNGTALLTIYTIEQTVENCNAGEGSDLDEARQQARNALGSLTSLDGWSNALETAAEYEKNQGNNG